MKDGSNKYASDALCIRIVHPADAKLGDGNSEMSMSKGAKKDFRKFFKRRSNIGKSIFFSGTCEINNGVNKVYLNRVLQPQYADEEVAIFGSEEYSET
jgi:hypothetical protein